MKTYIILNGKNLFIRQYATQEEAITFAQNYMDHSKPIFIREINDININLNN